MTCNQIYATITDELGVKRHVYHVASDFLAGVGVVCFGGVVFFTGLRDSYEKSEGESFEDICRMSTVDFEWFKKMR